jgi:hypothetical protein
MEPSPTPALAVQPEIEYDGATWERRVKHWLRLRYPGGQFEEVPAEHQGDYGIEGFSRDGIAYQCYAPKGALKVNDLYENQRKKITDDIGKFINRKAEFERLFGPLKIKSWWLVVPEHRSKKLVQHATAKALEVVQANLPYVAPDFFIHVADASEFAVEHQAAIRKGLQVLQLGECPVTAVQVQEWADGNDSLVEKLDKKIRAYSGEVRPERIRDLRERWITCFIAAENMLKKIQVTYPGVWEDLLALKQRKEDKLFLKYSTARASKDVLDETIEQLQRDILEKVPNLDSHHVEDLAVGTVSEWLHRCPLNFPDETGT